jgi:hypothetical protein
MNHDTSADRDTVLTCLIDQLYDDLEEYCRLVNPFGEMVLCFRVLMVRLLFVESRWRILNPSNLMHRRMTRYTNMSSNHFGGGYLDPFTCLVKLPCLQFSSLILFAFTIVTACSVLAASNNVGLVTYQMYTLKVEYFDSSLKEDLPASNFSLMINDCDISPDTGSNTTSPIYHIFLKPTSVNGFKILNADQWNTRPVIFVLEGSNDNGSTWITAGSSSFRWVVQGVRFLNWRSAISASQSSGRLVVDFRPTWPYFAQYVVGPCLASIGWAATVLYGLYRDIASARLLALFVLHFLSLTFLVAAAGYFATDRPLLAFGPLVSTVNSAIAAATLWRAGVLLADACALIGLLTIVLAVVEDCALFRDCTHLLASPPVFGAAALAAGAGFILLRRRFCARLLAGVADDRRHFARDWRELLDLPGSEAALRELDALASAAPAAAPRHLLPCSRGPAPTPAPAALLRRSSSSALPQSTPGPFRRAASTFSMSLSAFSPWADGGGDDVPVTSLDQLYAQAGRPLAAAARALSVLIPRGGERAV